MNLKTTVTAFLSLVSLSAMAQVPVEAVPNIDSLHAPFGPQDQQSFKTPARIHYPQTWFHLISGNVSAEGITEDFEAIARSGISGVQLFHGQFGGEWPGVDDQITALSPRWDDLVKHAAQEAQRLGLRFTMQNCSGWATSGGPWITPENAMRHLTYNRADVSGGQTNITLPLPHSAQDSWRDYRDIAVLAFPTPLGDSGTTLQPISARSNRDYPWREILCANASGPLQIPANANEPTWVEFTLDKPATLRTIELPSMNSINHSRCYEPGITLTVEAVAPDGALSRVMHAELPSANSQDNTPISFACDDSAPTDRYRITMTNRHHMSLHWIKLYTAARKNCWESEAGWTLRNLERANDNPEQDRAAYLSSDRIIDISSLLKADGCIEWQVPKGNWTILRIGHVNTGRRNSPAPAEGTGWECNKLDPSGARAQFEGYIGRLHNGPLKGGLLDGLLLDSWECETQTWTRDMEREFLARNDYSLRGWLPAVLGYVVNDQQTTARFLRDWRQTISDLFVDNFYGTMASLAKENDMDIVYESAAGDVFPADILEYYKHADVPMCEFWQPFSDGFVGSLNFKPIKPCASAAHMYGKPRVAAEAFTSFSHTWDEQWSMLKEVANLNITEGVSHMVYHTYTHNPQKPFLAPGTSFGGPGIGTPFLRGQTWWQSMPQINDYFARCSYMTERGHPVSDLIWFLGDELSPKSDQDPNFLRGYKYDYCNPDILINRLSVEDGLLVTPEGISYRMLWLPDNCRMVPQTLERILELVGEGATVVGCAPRWLATLNGGKQSQKRFDKAVKKIWGDGLSGVRNIGRGRVINSLSIVDALSVAGIEPDVRGDVLWSHRRIEGADWYFVCPQKGHAFNGDVDFRAVGAVEIWDPATGLVSPAQYITDGSRTGVVLDLMQSQSCFVVFRNDVAPAAYVAPAEFVESVELKGWNLSFPTGWGAPSNINIVDLQPWNKLDLSDEGRAFSGTATYKTDFDVSETDLARSCVLDLGRVEMIAEVSLNGMPVEVLWAPPYRVDATKYLRQGVNNLTVKVTNSWFNRLVYDAKQNPTARKTWVIRWPSPTSELRECGLLGPVTIKRK